MDALRASLKATRAPRKNQRQNRLPHGGRLASAV